MANSSEVVSPDCLRYQRFINTVATATSDSLTGYVCCNPKNLALFNFANIVVRRDYDEMHDVKIISGGPCGHEPAYGGFVGKGMLTAVIQGEIYIAPAFSNIFRLIVELSNDKSHGILAVIANSNGDCLNFGMAIEAAQSLGIKARLVVVSDDCCSTEKRGLTGVLLIQKIAAALSDQGRYVDDIYDFCEQLLKDVYSVSVTVRHCENEEKMMCDTCEFALPNDRLEIGAGMLGESAKLQQPLTEIGLFIPTVFEQMSSDKNSHQLKLDPDVPVVVLINSLGKASNIEVNIFAKEVVQYLRNQKIEILRILVGTFLTSLKAEGFTLTIMNVRNRDIIAMLDEPSEAVSWVKPVVTEDAPWSVYLEPRCAPVEDVIELRGPRLGKRQANLLLLVTQFACDALISCEKQLNIIDWEAGNGDAGTRIRIAAESINQIVAEANLSYPYSFLRSCGKVVSRKTAGSLGWLYGIMFEAAAKEFADHSQTRIVDGTVWLAALQRAIAALKRYTTKKEGDRTLIDPLSACATAMETGFAAKMPEVETFGVGVAAAEEVAQGTRVLPGKHPDPGAHAVGIWLRAAYEGVKLRCG